MIRYGGIMREINWIYDTYSCGRLGPDSASPMGYLINDNHMIEEFYDGYG